MTPQLYRPSLAMDLVAQALSRDCDRTVMVLSDGKIVTARDLRDFLRHIGVKSGDRASIADISRVDAKTVLVLHGSDPFRV